MSAVAAQARKNVCAQIARLFDESANVEAIEGFARAG